MTTRHKITSIALGFNGTLDGQGYDGPNPFSHDLSRPAEAWCADFVTDIYKRAHIPLPPMQPGFRTGFAGCPAAVNYGRRLHATRYPWHAEPGDIVLFDFPTPDHPQDGVADHTEIVTGHHDGWLGTIGGNSGPSNVDGYRGEGGVHRHRWHVPAGQGNSQGGQGNGQGGQGYGFGPFGGGGFWPGSGGGGGAGGNSSNSCASSTDKSQNTGNDCDKDSADNNGVGSDNHSNGDHDGQGSDNQGSDDHGSQGPDNHNGDHDGKDSGDNGSHDSGGDGPFHIASNDPTDHSDGSVDLPGINDDPPPGPNDFPFNDLPIGGGTDNGDKPSGDGPITILTGEAPTEVPEPFTLSLFAVGLGGAAMLRRRKNPAA